MTLLNTQSVVLSLYLRRDLDTESDDAVASGAYRSRNIVPLIFDDDTTEIVLHLIHFFLLLLAHF